MPVAARRQRKECVEKRARVTQQHLVRGSIEFRFFGRPVDTDQLTRRRKEWRIAEIHLIVQTAAYQDRKIRLLKCFGRGSILVDVGKAHISLAGLGQEFLVIGDIEDGDAQLQADFFEFCLGA